MRVLVTGSRAPVSMDIIRSLISSGNAVYSADSLNFPLGRFVTGIEKHFTLPKPNRNRAKFLKALTEILIANKIDLLIPTCEEIFFISKGHAELSKHTKLFCEPFERLNLLHNKFEFNKLVLEYNLHAPESWLLTRPEDKTKIPPNEPIVLKPVFSRFASHVIIKPTQKIINELVLNTPYLAQRFITGKEYCAYAIAHKGKVLIQCCYHPKYTAGAAAGIYFEPVKINAITRFIELFCTNYHFSGQIAFDFIVQNDKAFVLECNPRATSGFHLIANDINWHKILNAQQQPYQLPTQAFMLGLGMKLHGFKYLCDNPKQFLTDYQQAHDILRNKAYPWLGAKSMITLSNILFRMIKERKNFHGASTDDIEFNGDAHES